MYYRLYRFLTLLAGPLLPLLLRYRLAQGKEDTARLRERLGYASADAPGQKGKLLWVHAASMGESASVLPLVEAFLSRYPDWHVLITTVTLSSAKLVAEKLPNRAIHQFAPLDHPAVLQRFLTHWQPRLAVWVESELWPNMCMILKLSGCGMMLVNARMSERSFRRWRYFSTLLHMMLRCFDGIYPQSPADAERFRQLGALRVHYLGNLKYDAPPLTVESLALSQLQQQIAGRPVWLAASTHPGEEEQILAAHQAIKMKIPQLLTIIVPRHAPRGEGLATLLRGYGVSLSLRSRQEALKPDTAIYLADTMGELGLFYSLSPIVFIGGSLVPHGGQNLLEPARLGCALLCGYHMHNFAAICEGMLQAGALKQVQDSAMLANEVLSLLENPSLQQKLSQKALAFVTQQGGGIREGLLAEMQRIGNISPVI